MDHNTNHSHLAFHPNSLFLRTVLPLVLFIGFFISAGIYATHEVTRELYNHISIESLKNDTFFARGLLNSSHKKVAESTQGLSTQALQQATAADAEQKILLLLNRPSHGLLLLDDEGHTLLNTRSDKPAGTSINISDILQNKTAFIKGTTTQDGTTFAHTYYQPLGLYIVTFNNQSFTQAPFYQGMVSSSYIYIAVLFTGILLATYLAITTFVTNPITRLNRSMRDIIKQDDFDYNVPVGGSNELAQQARLFNTLLHHLRDRDSKLKEHRESLEDLVAERTDKLISIQEKMVQQERLAAIGEFSSSIAHELRNPLSSIKMGIEQITPLVTSLDSKSTRRMELVQAEITRLDSMLKGILAFAANTPTELACYPLEDILAQALPTFEALAKDNKAEINTLGFKSPCIVTADKNKLLQALINLVKNACEAHEGAAPVRISASHDDNVVRLQVQNGGRPIPADVMDRLFEPFFTTKPEGTGLGLPTTKRLIEEMDGQIEVESTPALGTIVTITLPLAKE